MKRPFWYADWFVALVVVVIFLLVSNTTPLRSLERSFYDAGVVNTTRDPHPDVAVIAIDDDSIAQLGRWPWPRDRHAALIDMLSQAGAKVVVYSVFFTEPQEDPGLVLIRQLNEGIAQSNMAALSTPDMKQGLKAAIDDVAKQVEGLQVHAFEQASQLAAFQEAAKLDAAGEGADVNSQAASPEATDPMAQVPLADLAALDQISQLLTDVLPQEAAAISDALASAETQLDTDATLAVSIAQANNVILPQFFDMIPPLGAPDSELPEWVAASAIPDDGISNIIAATEDGVGPLRSSTVVFPIEKIAGGSQGLGHLNSDLDVDGAVRAEPLVVDYHGQYFPSVSLMAAAKSLNLGIEDIHVVLGKSIQLGRLVIDTDEFSRMKTFFYSPNGEEEPFEVDSFASVINGQVKAKKFEGKIVVIGATATGIGTTQVTPISAGMAPAVTLAHSISSILQEDFFIEPDWAVWATIAAYLVVGLYLILLLPLLNAGVAVVLTTLLALGTAGAQFYLMTAETTWLPLTLPIVLLIVGHVLLSTKRYLVTEKSKLKTEAESAESNKMLALQFQGQGQLDMAFEKFQRVPIDDSVMGLLYNLALDYESKRKPAKARAVFEYMADYNIKFKDIENRIDRNRNMEETVILGGSSRGGSAAGTLILDGGASKPTLGRYDVEKELGKGAMGVVYLGKDPKINREVAIKTMALADEFEGPELEEAKSRFFREAESAGRLAHPNIVTIFDAGEEHDLAFIAMEFLRGKEMTDYTKKDALLSVSLVLEVIARAADALDYAHSNNVIHRDIKPANMMYGPPEGDVKITDFGIARISDSSRTKTGMVLGTPSYMSPEQLAGKKVDGRSDLFSLGVTMYQFLTGELPFSGDSLATLMYRIANEEHPDILSVRADLPPCVKTVVDKSMAKDLDQRYARGADMARDARACAASLAGG